MTIDVVAVLWFVLTYCGESCEPADESHNDEIGSFTVLHNIVEPSLNKRVEDSLRIGTGRQGVGGCERLKCVRVLLQGQT
jgi:hypothetical protein